MRITAHVVVPDADAAAEWYGGAFGARVVDRIPLPDRRALSVTLRFGDSEVHIGGELPEAGILSPLSIGGTPVVLQISTDDADALWKRALEAGAEVRHELADQFWGERHGQLTDPFGHRWNIAQRVREVSAEEIAAGAAKAFSRG